MTVEYKIKPGDVVLHKPSGERWVVAYADHERNELSWFGWPEGFAKISDCELVKSVTFEEALKDLVLWAEPRQQRVGDLRHRYAASMLARVGLALAEKVQS